MKKNTSGFQNSSGLSHQNVNNLKNNWMGEKRLVAVLLGISVFLNLCFFIGIVYLFDKQDAQSALQKEYEELGAQYNLILSKNNESDTLLLEGQSLVNEGKELINQMELDITKLELEKDGLFQENNNLNDNVDNLTARISDLEDQLQISKDEVQLLASNNSTSQSTTTSDSTGTFTIGSTKEEVKSVMGAPSQIVDFMNEWGYEYSSISFDENNLVSGWNDISDNLKFR